VNGASSWEVRTRQWCSVAWATGSDDLQNRGRLRRTYQFDRSSISRAIRLAALSASKPSRASVTSAVVAATSARIHRSSTEVAAGGGDDGAQPGSGAHPSRSA
jgi:hypothetical protein